MSEKLMRNPSKGKPTSLISTDIMEDHSSKREIKSRHLKYLILLLPAYFIMLGLTLSSSGNANPFDMTQDSNHMGYKFVTMLLFAWLWMGLLRIFLFLSPVVVIFVVAMLKLPVEMLKNIVEHIRSIAVPLARFSMYIFLTVYFKAFFFEKKDDIGKNTVIFNCILVLAVLTGLVFVEAVYIRRIGLSFHEMAFADRIKTNKIALKTIDKLDRCIENTSRDLFNIDLSSNTQALLQAKRLFEALSHGRDEVVMSDFVPYFTSVEEAQEAFNIFDKNGDGDIIRSEMRSIVLFIYEERRALNNSLSDITHAIAKLDKILICVCFFVTFFVALAIFSSDPVKTIVPFSSFLIGLSFVFGQSARDTFDSILFVFVTHPFDTNDVVLVKDERLIVKELGLLTTTFIRFDGQECYFPNSVLNKQTIFNIRRSKAQGEVIKVDVGFDTTMDQITQLNILLKEFLAKNSRDYDVDITVNVIDLNQMSKLTLTMMLNYKRNWMDGKLRMRLKTKFNMELKECLSKLNFRFSLPLQPFTGIEKTEKVE